MIFIGPPRRLSQAGVTAGVTSGNRVEWNTENVDGRNHCVDGSVSADEPLALLRWSVKRQGDCPKLVLPTTGHWEVVK